MHVLHVHAHIAVVIREVFRHALGQRRDQHAFASFRAVANLAQQVVNLIVRGPDLDKRIGQPRGPDYLLDNQPFALV